MCFFLSLGFTIALMIFVDDLNTTWPHLHHTPWDGLHLADVVMPFFLWMVGFSVPIAIGRRLDRGATSGQVARQILSRTVKLFVLGVLISGGGLPDGDCTESANIARVCVGYDLRTIRISGILQRIAVCYMVVALVTLCSMVKMEPILRRIERGVTEHWSFEVRFNPILIRFNPIKCDIFVNRSESSAACPTRTGFARCSATASSGSATASG